MKRTLLSITVALMALTMFFAACQDPLSDYSVENKAVLPEIAGPEWVKAEALPGANLITWAYNKDAKGYAIYRQEVDTAGKELSTFLEVGTTDLKTGEYIDAVSRRNQLKDKALYKYGVVAYSNASLARSVDYVKDGVTYADAVTATIPAQGTEILKLKTPDYAITIDHAVVQGQDGQELLVSWESPHPAFNYAVKYSLGNATLAADLTNFGNSEIVGDPIKYYHTPLFGGTTQISLGVAFADQYYYKPALLTKAITGLTLTDPLAFTPSSFYASRNSGYVSITWQSDSSQVPNVGDYKLYRVETKGVYTNNNTQIEVVGDWTAVTGIYNIDNNNNQVTVIETGLDPAKNYLYALYAEVGGRKSSVALVGLAAETVSLAELEFDVEHSYTEAADVRTYSATIGWNAVEGLTGNYKLERAITAKYPTETTGAFTVVSATPAIPTAVGGRYTVIDSSLPIRQSYMYRLTATINGVEVIGYKSLSDAPFKEYVADNYTANNSSTFPYSVAPSSTTAYATEISFNPGTDYLKDITADIYRAVVPATTYVNNAGFITDAYEEAAFTKLTTTAHSVFDGSYLDTGLTIGTQYIYRVEYKAGGQPLYYSDNFHYYDGNKGKYVEYTGYVQTPSVPYTYMTNSYPGIVNGTTTRNYYEVYNTSASYALIGAQIATQTRTYNTTTSEWSEWGPGGPMTGTIAFHEDSKGETLKWKVGNTEVDAKIAANNYYFYVSPPATTPANTQYRLVLVDKSPDKAANYSFLVNLP